MGPMAGGRNRTPQKKLPEGARIVLAAASAELRIVAHDSSFNQTVIFPGARHRHPNLEQFF